MLKKNHKIKSIVSIFLCLFSINLFCNQINAADKGIGWYCVRAKDNKQPRADANMLFIEKYNGYYIDKKHGDDNKEKVLYLTFDAGYENGNVRKIVDIMDEENVTGAFFILGNLIERNGDLVKQIADNGNLVCNHTNKHKDMTCTKSIDEFKTELENLEKLYFNLTGVQMAKFYRPPEGKFNERTMKYADELGYKTIFWSFAYADWDNGNQVAPDKALNKILSNVHNGAVILLHPTSDTNAAIMKDLLVSLKEQGYRFGTLFELCDIEKGSDL